MLMFFASDVVVSKGYQNAPALKFSEKGDFVRFRVGQKVYDPRAEDNHRWINVTVKSFDPVLVDRIRKMGLKEGSFISLSGRYDEDLEYSGSKRPNDGQKTASNTQNSSAPAPAADPQEGFQMPGNFTGYEGFGGGNNFFNL